MVLEAGNSPTSTITVSDDGQIGGNEIGIAANSAVTITNAGLIEASDGATGTAIVLNNTGKNTITNSGVIAGLGGVAIEDQASSTDAVTNSGDIMGDINLFEGNDTVANSGSINGNVILGNGNNTLTNTLTGTVDSVSAGTDNDTLTNAGLIGGPVDLSGGTNKLTNSGSIGGRGRLRQRQRYTYQYG